jgi:hypothetical protein
MAILSRKDLLVAAEANRIRSDSYAETVKSIIDSHDLVFGIWRDPSETDGVGMIMLKGRRRSRAVSAGVEAAPAGTVRFRDPEVSLRWSAILFDTRDDALAAHRTFGEPGTGKSGE